MKDLVHRLQAAVTRAALIVLLAAGPVLASSHMDAPLITRDPSANTTDVYAFRSASEDGATQYLTTALAVYPFEEPGIGPNNYSFDDNVLYEIHVALGGDVAAGRPTLSYQGVTSEALLDRYTTGAIAELARGYRAFAGQRDDGFYADIQSIFDLDPDQGGPHHGPGAPGRQPR